MVFSFSWKWTATVILFVGLIIHFKVNPVGSFEDPDWFEIIEGGFDTYKIRIDDLKSLMDPQECSQEPFRAACTLAHDYLTLVCSGQHIPKNRLSRWWLELQTGKRKLKNLNASDFEMTLGHCPAHKRSFALIQAVNAFLSVTQDPHSYVITSRWVWNQFIQQSKPLRPLIIRWNSQQVPYLSFWDPALISWDRDPPLGSQVMAINGVPVDSRLGSYDKQLVWGQRVSLTLRWPGNQKIITVKGTLGSPRSQWLLDRQWESLGLWRVRFERFYSGVCQHVEQILNQARQQNIRMLILDLRDNGGGQLQESLCLADLFLPKGVPLLDLIDPQGRLLERYWSQSPAQWPGAVMVWVNHFSASASEILAGILKVYARAQVIGSLTYGKGTFQEGQIIPGQSPNQDLIYFRTAGFYRLPNGFLVQRQGLEPHLSIHCPLCDDQPAELSLYPWSLKPPVNSGEHPVNWPYEKISFIKPLELLAPCIDPSGILSRDEYLWHWLWWLPQKGLFEACANSL